MGKKKMLMRKFGSIAIVNNTFIGGVASVINTPALLAAKLKYYPSGVGFNENDIQNFTIVGDDIECYIGVDYLIPSYQFTNINELTYFRDLGLNLKQIGTTTNPVFLNCPNLYDVSIEGIINMIANQVFSGTLVTNISLPNCTYVAAGCFRLVTFYYIPNCTNLGGSALDNNAILNTSSTVVYAHPSLQTNNSGNPDGDLQGVINAGGKVTYVTNFNKPQTTTDLSVNTVYTTSISLDWSIPTSTNAIDFYEVYIDGVFYKNVSTNKITIAGLTNLQTYNFSVIAVDIFYNKSEMSNVVTQQINGVGYPWQDNIISYYQFENNVLDSVGTNNGVATDITYASGQVGNAAVFNGSTSFINCGNATNLQSYPISIVSVIKTSNAGSGYRGLVVKQFNYGLYLNSNVLTYYDWATTTPKSTGVNLADNNYHTVIKTIDALGNVNIYVDAVLVLTDTITLVNTNEDLVIGAGLSDGSIQNFNGSIDDTSLLNKELSQAEVNEITNIHNAGLPLI